MLAALIFVMPPALVEGLAFVGDRGDSAGFGLIGGAICLCCALVKLGTITIASSAVGRSLGFLLKNESTKFLNFCE